MSPAERALLAAARDDPADALTRLVYADWLEGEGDDPRRGAYLRAWCAMLAADLRELDEYAEGAELLESLANRLDVDWLAAVGAARFHLTDPEQVAHRVEAFFLRFGGSAGLLDARAFAVYGSGGDWEVWYETAGRPSPVALCVERSTGRVHMMDERGRRARTHHPDHTAPSRTDGRHP